NAIMGIYYLHGDTQSADQVNQGDLDALEADAAEKGGNTIYYQHDEATKTTYYLIPTERLPLLMPFDGIVPDPILDAADKPLRAIVELGYDRSDYGKPTTAGIVPAVNPITAATQVGNATVEGVQGLAQSGGVSTQNTLANRTSGADSASITNV